MEIIEPGLKLLTDRFMQRASITRVLGECTYKGTVSNWSGKNCQCSNFCCQQNLKSPVAHEQEHVLSPIASLKCGGKKIKGCQILPIVVDLPKNAVS